MTRWIGGRPVYALLFKGLGWFAGFAIGSLFKLAVATVAVAVKLTIQAPVFVLLFAVTAIVEHWIPDSPTVRVAALVLLAVTVGTTIAEEAHWKRQPPPRGHWRNGANGRRYVKAKDISKRDHRRWERAREQQRRTQPPLTTRAVHEARLRAARAQARIDRALALKEPKSTRTPWFRSPPLDKETST